MAVISIEYNDGETENLGYKSVDLSYDNLKKTKKFDSGDFVRDWYDCIKFFIQKETGEPLGHSSSVDHFIMDGAPYGSAYLHVEDGKVELKYVDKSKPNYIFNQREIYENGIEFFVKENTQPTWSELQKLCGDKKQEDVK